MNRRDRRPAQTYEGHTVDRVAVRRDPSKDRAPVWTGVPDTWLAWRFEYSLAGKLVGVLRCIAPPDYCLGWLVDIARTMYRHSVLSPR